MAHHWLVNMLQIMWQWLQTRDVICRKKINPTDYGPSTNCPADQKPSISEKVQYCNSIDCLADWDTQEGLLVSTPYF